MPPTPLRAPKSCGKLWQEWSPIVPIRGDKAVPVLDRLLQRAACMLSGHWHPGRVPADAASGKDRPNVHTAGRERGRSGMGHGWLRRCGVQSAGVHPRQRCNSRSGPLMSHPSASGPLAVGTRALPLFATNPYKSGAFFSFTVCRGPLAGSKPEFDRTLPEAGAFDEEGAMAAMTSDSPQVLSHMLEEEYM